MKATDMSPSTRVSVANPRSAKIRRRSSGDGIRSSKATNTAISASPATMQSHVAALLHPHTADCWNPSTTNLIAAVTSTVAAVVERGRALRVVGLGPPDEVQREAVGAG